MIGRPEPAAAAALVTPPCKNNIVRSDTDNADTQQFDIMAVDLSGFPVTPDFKKPERFPSTTSVDTKRWVYQHPNEPKPDRLPSEAPPAVPTQEEKPSAAPPALPDQEELPSAVEEPMLDARDDDFQDDGAAPVLVDEAPAKACQRFFLSVPWLLSKLIRHAYTCYQVSDLPFLALVPRRYTSLSLVMHICITYIIHIQYFIILLYLR